MTKKKIGELDGTPIVTGDKNYANEHEYYMTLNGDNTYLKLEQRTNGDLFKTVLGSGSGSSGNTGDKSANMFGIVENMTEEEIAIFQQNNPGNQFNFARKIRKEDIFASMFLYENTSDVFAGWYISEYNEGPSYRNQSDGKFVKVVLNTVNVPFYSPDAEASLVQSDSAPNLMGLSSDWLYGVTTLQQG